MTLPSPVPDEILLQHRALVTRAARRMRARLPASVALDDLESAGFVGLIEALERFDPSRGVPFEPYARHRIHGAMIDLLRTADWVSHAVRRKVRDLTWARGEGRDDERTARRLGLTREGLRALEQQAAVPVVVSLDGPTADGPDAGWPDRLGDGGPDPEGILQDRERLDQLARALDRLPPREAAALRGFYLDGLPLKEIGRALGVTDSRACQLCGQGVRRLRQALAQAA